MKPVSRSSISFTNLSSCFTRTSGNRLLLHTSLGEGIVQWFKPEKGLRVHVWDCLFFEDIELYNTGLLGNKQQVFTLAYFPDRDGLEVWHLFQQAIPWNSLFLSTVSDFRLSIASARRYRCITVSFSSDWLLHVMQTTTALQDTISRIEKLEALQNITKEESAVLEEMFLVNPQQHTRHFYIKTAVLKLICDFLYRLKNEQPSAERAGIHGTLTAVEHYLNQHITKEFAGTKALAKQFSMSETTLKRQFKKKYGISISAFLTSKKMQYARDLIHQQGVSIAEASCKVCYRSVHNFKEVFKKYFH